MIPHYSYIKSFSEDPETYQVGEWKIPLPDMPKESEMWNYNKKIKDQKYERLWFPKNFKYLNKTEQEQVAEELLQNHRQNGRWILIKGKPFYFTPEADVYYSFWIEEYGGLPDFRLEGLEYFYLLDFAWRHPRIFGTLDIKPRRIGDTGKTLSYGHQGAIRYRNYRFGMQNMKDEDAAKNYQRILKAHKRLPPIYKPIMPGKDDPQKAMEFRYPGSHVTRKKMDAGEAGLDNYSADVLEMNSTIDYRPTKFKEYDGHRLSFYHLDEPGKITNMDVIEQLGVIRRCVSLHDGNLIIGKIAYTTTIEEMSDGYTVDVMQRLWDDSSPEQFDEQGRTLSGLIRILRTTYDNAACDAYGFPKKAEKKEEINKILEMYDKSDRLLEKTNFLRRSPRDIEDALKPPETDCDLRPGILDKQIDILKRRGSKAVKGDLVWKDGTMFTEEGKVSEVEWRPHEKGRWEISQQPVRPNAMMYDEEGRSILANKVFYAVGVDTVDTKVSTDRSGKYKSSLDKLSKQGIVVHRVFDPSVDNEASGLRYVGDEIANPEIMETGKPVCTYLYRHPNPLQNFEDVLKTLRYYGTDAIVEKNRPYIKNKMEELGLHQYLQFRPKQSYPDYRTNRTREVGVHANEHIVDLYINLMVEDISKYTPANEHQTLLQDHRRFNRENRGKRDITVARGMCMIALIDKDSRMRRKHERENQAKSEGSDLSSLGFTKHKRIV